MSDALNQNMHFSDQDLNRWGVNKFKLSVNVQDTYNQLSLSNFIIKYFDKSEYKNTLVAFHTFIKRDSTLLIKMLRNSYTITNNEGKMKK